MIIKIRTGGPVAIGSPVRGRLVGSTSGALIGALKDVDVMTARVSWTKGQFFRTISGQHYEIVAEKDDANER